MIAEVIINSNVKNLNRTFDYNIPFEMEEKVNIGSRVLVKFGNIKKLEEGFVVNIKESSEFEVKDMPVTVAVDTEGNSIHTTGPAKWRTINK